MVYSSQDELSNIIIIIIIIITVEPLITDNLINGQSN
jgi:hypothetical protein